ncbi:MAG TPA: alpha/beta hydrolase [Candidatus Limnocylindrales bacterium]|nr:alpha/beta hydrolase [Candidatus Limnocylindrales bacterium]
MALPDPLDASAGDLPPAASAALDDPPAADEDVVTSDGIPFAVRRWGARDAPPLLLLHGVTASSRIWWRVGPALAAGLGRRVIAVDQAGHGRTGHWHGGVAFRANARFVAGFVTAAGLARDDVVIVGHSWGGMTLAAMPAVGLRPAISVLLDPPAAPARTMVAMLDDPADGHQDDVDAAVRILGAVHPTWSWGDLTGKAEALTLFDEAAVRAILGDNGAWDGGVAELRELAETAGRAAAEQVRLVRGAPAAGGLVPDGTAAEIAALIGEEHVTTIAGGTHAPMRTRPEATTLALIRAIDPAASGC